MNTPTQQSNRGLHAGSRRRRARLAALLWTALILFLLLAPLPPTPAAPSGMDRWVHSVLFAVETGLVAAASPGRRGRRIAAGSLAAAALALLTELAQGLIPYRSLQLSDLAADLAGVVAASLLLVPGYSDGWRRQKNESGTGA